MSTNVPAWVGQRPVFTASKKLRLTSVSARLFCGDLVVNLDSLASTNYTLELTLSAVGEHTDEALSALHGLELSGIVSCRGLLSLSITGKLSVVAAPLAEWLREWIYVDEEASGEMPAQLVEYGLVNAQRSREMFRSTTLQRLS